MPPPSNSTAYNSSCSPASGCGESSSNSTASTTNNEINSVRELNRLLESALRNIGGDDDEYSLSTPKENQPSSSSSSFRVDPPSPGNGINIIATGTSHSNITNNSNSSSEMVGDAASWRLDTARRLSSLLASQNLYHPEDGKDNLLLPALQRQSRYWTPLLLSWLKGEIENNGSSSDHDTTTTTLNNTLDLPQKAKQRRRQQRQNMAQLSSSLISAEVQIEALRALTALTEWIALVRRKAPTTTTMEGEAEVVEGAPDCVHTKYATSQLLLTAGCTPHNPLSASSQRLLLRQPDAVPMIVSLLSCPDAAIHEQAMWILGSIASSGLGAMALPTPLPHAAARAAAAEVTKMMSERSSSSSGLDGSMSVAIPTAAVSSSSEMVGRTANDTPTANNIPSVIQRSSNGGKEKSSISARDVIFAAGAMDPILKCLSDNPHNIPLHRVGAWCLSNLVEGRYSSSSSTNEKDSSISSSTTSIRKPVAVEEMDIYTLLPTVKRMLHMDDTEVLTHTCWTLSHFCDGPAYHIAAVIYYTADREPKELSTKNGLVPRLVELLLHPSPKVAKPALRTVGNIVCADSTDQQDQSDGTTRPVVDFTEIILEWNAVSCLRQLVEHPNREIQKEACWTLSNIAAGTASQIQAVIDSGAIRPLVDIVNDERTDKEVRSEACWVVLNATSCGSDEQISTLIQEGCVSVLGVLLTEPNMVMMALEGVERVLQAEETQDAVDLAYKSEEELGQRPTILKCASLIKAVTESQHNSTAVSKRAKWIWEQHFVSCALCHNNYSVCRILSSQFCNECKCHVCWKCDCRVYHLSYQEELWAEDEQKTAESKNQKKSKKQKKKQKMKEKAAEKKKLDVQVMTAQPPLPSSGPAVASIKGNESPTNTSKANANANEDPSSRKVSSSPSPSRGTIESDSASLGAADDNTGDNTTGGATVNDSCDTNYRQPPIDLVLYLQETGSIIALAKLMDSLYDHEFEEEDGDGDERDGRHQQQKTVDLNHRVMTTQ